MPIYHGNWVRFILAFSIGLSTEALTFINDQHFGCLPSIECGFARAYVLDLLLNVVLARCDRSPRVDGHTC